MKVKTNYNKYYNLWSTDNDKTEANDEVVIKSVYDPSPVGYSLPAVNAFTGFTTTGGNTNNSSEFNVQGVFNKGWYFYTQPNKQGETFFFPAVGRRYLESGRLLGVNISGWCWTTGPTNLGGGHLLNFASEYVYPLHVVSTYGVCCVAGPLNRRDGRFSAFGSSYVHPLGGTYRSYGMPVRSAEEKIVLVWLR